MNDFTCQKVITIEQIQNTCWFNSILMVCLYSKNMRQLLRNKIKTLQTINNIQHIFIDVLNNKFLEESVGSPDYMYNIFKTHSPQIILQELHNYNSELFMFNPFKGNQPQFISGAYIHKFLSLFNIPFDRILYLDQLNDKSFIISTQYFEDIYNLKNENETKLSFSKSYTFQKNLPVIKQTYNRLYQNYLNNKIEVVLINYLYSTTDKYHNTYELKEHNVYFKIDIPNLSNTITLKNSEFLIDSMIISNFNFYECNLGHSIAGVTCGSDRYLYNGWVSYTQDRNMYNNIYNNIPCALIKYDWFKTTDFSFCLNHNQCNIKKLSIQEENLIERQELCFNVTKGENMHIFVNKKLINPTFF